MLLQAAEQAGKADLAASLKGADAGLQIPPNLTGLAQARAAFDAGNPEGAAEKPAGSLCESEHRAVADRCPRAGGGDRKPRNSESVRLRPSPPRPAHPRGRGRG